tara:strand:- start:181 stop:282 length:102 start_codon:yes stop_codon:yes gene_type:complete
MKEFGSRLNGEQKRNGGGGILVEGAFYCQLPLT